MKQLTEYDVLTALDEDILNAQMELQAARPTQFNTTLLEILKEKNDMGKASARTYLRLTPDATMYVSCQHFPLAIYKGISEDFLKELNRRENFELYLEPGLDHAMIKFVYHF